MNNKIPLHIYIYIYIYIFLTLSAGAVEYADCTSAEATCWPCVATCKALGQAPGGGAVIDPVTVVNVLQHTTLALTWSDRQSDRPDPINRLVMSSPSTYIFYRDPTFKSALTASSQTLSLTC